MASDSENSSKSIREEIITDLSQEIVNQYNMAAAEGEDLVIAYLDKSMEELSLEEVSDLKRVKRTRWFKELRSKVKKKAYYSLRTYKGDLAGLEELTAYLRNLTPSGFQQEKEKILQKLGRLHVSVKERSAEMEEFYELLLRELSGLSVNIESILDIGCGIQPAFVPFGSFGFEMRYFAIDKDRSCIDLLEAYRQSVPEFNLSCMAWDLKEGWGPVKDKVTIQNFDLAFLLKFIPVVNRIERGTEQLLQNIPAKTLIVSGAKYAMAKRRSIERRERKEIEAYLFQSGREILSSFEISSEFFYIAK